MPKPLFITLLILLPGLSVGITGSGSVALVVLLIVLIANPIIWKVRKDRYFNSEQFTTLSAAIDSVVREHNQIVSYVAEMRSRDAFELGESLSGQYASLAKFENTSTWNNRRDRNIAEYAPPRSQRLAPGCPERQHGPNQVPDEVLPYQC